MKRYRILVVILLALGLMGSYCIWVAVQLRGAVPLVNGYRYFRMPSGVMIDCNPSDKQEVRDRLDRIELRTQGTPETIRFPSVGPDVDGYRVYQDIIAGHVAKEEYPYEFGDQFGPPRQQRPLGYFIIDVRDDEMYDGLNKVQWLERLHDFGVNSEPRLFKPSVFDKLLRRNQPSGE